MKLRTFRIICGLIFLTTVGIAMTEDGPLEVKAASYVPPKSKPASYSAPEDEFATYVRIFKLEAEYRKVHTKVDKIKIVMVDKEKLSMSNAIGICFPARNTIEILKAYWDQANFSQREILIMHELGHCALDLDHDNSEGYLGPNSIMRSDVLNPSYYNNFRKNLVDELFAKVK